MKLPAPHATKAEGIPGTEGWERMYPYHYQFADDDPARLDYEAQAFWFYDALHYPEPLYPFDSIWEDAIQMSLSQYNHRIFRVPPARGIDHRILHGYVYLSPVTIADPAEIAARVPDFVERAGFYYERWDELEAGWKIKVEALIGELRALAIPRLPELEPLRVVTDAVGESSGFHLLQAFDRLVALGVRCWQYHFEFLNLGYAAYVTFSEFVRSLFPSLPMQDLTRMISGIDVVMYRPDAELKALARQALALGVDARLTASTSWVDAQARLAEDDAGRRWLAALEAARDPWFYVSTGTGFYHHHRCWNDRMDVPLAGIRTYLDQLRRGLDIERPVARIRAERDALTGKLRALIPTDDDRAQFDRLLAIARTVFPYVENHLFYVEHWFHSIFWNKVREVGALLAAHGILEDAEDVWYLRHAEIKDALWDVTAAWATGVPPRGRTTWPREIAWRKPVLEAFRRWRPPPALGTVPDAIREPFTIMLWGVTDESLAAWARRDGGGAPADVIEGIPVSQGVVSGRVRVCRTIDELGLLEEGEILVAPTTSPSWAPAFAKVRACVTDVGGVMSHAAIVCREYGLPAIVGTGDATRLLETGMEVEVDGSTGLIRIARRA